MYVLLRHTNPVTRQRGKQITNQPRLTIILIQIYSTNLLSLEIETQNNPVIYLVGGFNPSEKE